MDFKLKIMDGVLSRVYEDESVVPSPEFEIRPKKDGKEYIFFPDGEDYPLDKRGVIQTVYQKAVNASYDDEGEPTEEQVLTFYLGPRYTQWVRNQFDFLAFKTDEHNNKLFNTAFVPAIDVLLDMAETKKSELVEEKKQAGIGKIVSDNKEFIKDLMLFYDVETEEEALELFIEDLKKEPEVEPEVVEFLKSTGYEVETILDTAIIFAEGVEDLYEENSFDNGYITVKGLKPHLNGESDEGLWVGFALAYKVPALEVEEDEEDEVEPDQLSEDLPTEEETSDEDSKEEEEDSTEEEPKAHAPNAIIFTVYDGGDPYGVNPMGLALEPSDGTFVGNLEDLAPDYAENIPSQTGPVFMRLNELETHVTNQEIISNPEGNGLAIYFNAENLPNIFSKVVEWQWIYEDEDTLEVSDPQKAVIFFNVNPEEPSQEEEEEPEVTVPEEKGDEEEKDKS